MAIVRTNKRTTEHLVSETTNVRIEGEVTYNDNLQITSFTGSSVSLTDETKRGYFNYTEPNLEEVAYNYNGNYTIRRTTEEAVYEAVAEIKNQLNEEAE